MSYFLLKSKYFVVLLKKIDFGIELTSYSTFFKESHGRRG